MGHICCPERNKADGHWHAVHSYILSKSQLYYTNRLCARLSSRWIAIDKPNKLTSGNGIITPTQPTVAYVPFILFFASWFFPSTSSSCSYWLVDRWARDSLSLSPAIWLCQKPTKSIVWVILCIVSGSFDFWWVRASVHYFDPHAALHTVA